MNEFKLHDDAGYTTRFQVKSDTAVMVEDFDQNGRSLGWPNTLNRAEARRIWKLRISQGYVDPREGNRVWNVSIMATPEDNGYCLSFEDYAKAAKEADQANADGCYNVRLWAS